MTNRSARLVAAVLLLAGFGVTVPLAETAGAAPITIRVPADQPTIQAAIVAANPGDSVLVFPGTYTENIDFLGKAITVRSKAGWASTTIDGGLLDSVVKFSHGEQRSSVLRGFTLTRGRAYNGPGTGGGIYINGSSPTVDTNLITNNQACGAGGGIYTNGGAPKIVNNTISLNQQSGCSGGVGGGAISVGNATGAEITGNTMSQNSWGSSGGGLSLFAAGSPRIMNNVVSGNSPGGLWIVNDSPATIVQNLIVNNPGGSGVEVSPPSGTVGPTFVNNTIVAATGTVAVLAGGFDSTTRFFNNVFVSNQAAQPAVRCDTTYSPTPPQFTTNDAWANGGPAMTGSCAAIPGTQGNIALDPKFRAPGTGDYRLVPSSPAVDAGTNSAPSVPAQDLDGLKRRVDGDGNGKAVVDLGAYELPAHAFQVTPPTGPPGTVVQATGSGFAPGDQVAVTYQTLTSPPKVALCTATVSATGAIACSGSIPSGSAAGPAGAHRIDAVGSSPGAQATTIFLLTSVSPPVQMGSPVGHLGNDPENGAIDQHWLNIGAPHVDKRTGDRFADYSNCTSNAYGCSSGINTEYSDGTYFFTVDVPSVPPGGVDLQVYDPEYADGFASCNNQWLSASQLTALQASYPDAQTRYAAGPSNYCTGDDNTDLITPQPTAWLVRDSSISQTQPLQNPVIPTGGPAGPCAHQFKGYNPPQNSPTYWYDLLDPTNGATYDADFAASFHRYYTMCHVTSPGRYFIQVRSSVPFNAGFRNDPAYLSKSEAVPEDTNLSGQNRYSIRAVNSGTNTVTTAASASALARLPVATNSTGNSASFYLARLLPGSGSTGRFLALEFYDIGDVPGTTTLTIVPPPDAAGGLPACSDWTINANPANPLPAGAVINGCTLSGITNNSYPGGFNAALVSVRVAVPGNYTCDAANPFGCWFKITMSYSSGAPVNDTTTWGATGGDISGP